MSRFREGPPGVLLVAEDPLSASARKALLPLLAALPTAVLNPPRGNQIMWRGLERLNIATLACCVTQAQSAGSPLVQNE